MEHAADYAADVARHMIMLDGTKEEIPNDICELIQTAGTLAVESYAKAVNTFFSKDVPVAVEILKSQQRIDVLDQEIAASVHR
jgi:phosphate uptake regulator